MITATPQTRSRSSWSKSQDISRIFDLDRICKLIGVETLTDFDERLISWDETYGCAMKQALDDGYSEAEAETIAEKAESDERDDAHKKYRNAVLSAAGWLLGEHGLELVELKNGWTWRLVPTESWRDAAGKILTTINGYGMFEFRDVREFCSSGPYTECQAVMGHLGWMKTYAQVYGDVSAEARVESAMRR